MSKKGLFRDFKHTIGYILFKKIFLGYIFVVLLVTSYEIYSLYSFSKNVVLKDLINTEKSFYNVLATSIWHFDEIKIKSDIDAIIDAKTITGISILSPLNEVIVLKGTVLENQNNFKEFIFKKDENIIFSNNLLSHSFDLINHENSPDEVLAKITFYTQKNVIFDLAKENIYLILINSIFTAFILWILFIYFANKLLTIPLRQLTKATKDLRIKEYKEINISLNTSHTHELNTLVETFNTMSKRINESYINLKELNIILEEQKDELIQANKHKDTFLANMSHELKTPLNSINIISSVMMKNKKHHLDEKQIENLEVINSCGNDLLYLINDVLDISKLEAKEVILDCENINFYEMIKDIKNMFFPQIKQKNLNFVFEYDKKIDFIYSDKNRIKQIIKNLLSNSLKFMKEGNLSLLIKDEALNIKILVKDEGIGIENNKLEHIFDRFKQVDGSTTRRYGGTGLGLAICKELAMLLQGDISVKSKINKGTTFTLILPKKLKILNKEEIEKNNKKEKINIVEILEQKKEKPLDTKEIKETKLENILILNNDPSVFFSLIIVLKKVFSVHQVFSFEEFILKNELANFSLLIIDISKLKENELNIIKKIKKKKLIIYEDDENDFIENTKCICLKKPLDKTIFMNKINACFE